MPRGPGKKENYNLDYSRFNAFDRLDAEEGNEASRRKHAQDEADAAGGRPEMPEGMPDMRDLLRSMPPELQEAYHLMSVAKANGDTKAQQRANELALKAVEKGGPEVRKTFMENIGKQMPEIASKLDRDLAGIEPGAEVDVKTMLEGATEEVVRNRLREESTEDTSLRIDDLRKNMEDGAKAAREEMDKLQAKQDELEHIKDPEAFFKFMQEEGITQEDIQRIFSGDEQHMQARFNETIEDRTASKDVSKKDSVEALKKVDDLHGALFGKPSEEEAAEAPEPAETKPQRPPPEPKEPEVTIPVYRLQYEKDDAGKYTSVELKCSLPGIKDMSMVNLDVSEKHLRLSTMAPAPRYAVNAGPFPVLIDPSKARAKYSKKREELSISVPAK